MEVREASSGRLANIHEFKRLPGISPRLFFVCVGRGENQTSGVILDNSPLCMLRCRIRRLEELKLGSETAHTFRIAAAQVGTLRRRFFERNCA